MEIAEFAQTILYSDSLQDKLIQPGIFTDTHPHFSGILPVFPARAANFQLMKNSQNRIPFPKSKDLDTKPELAGQIFHFFANHELLALELMALLLLRFPWMPTALRQGLAQTMVEEQNHLSLYMNQMHLHGIELGAIPMGAHFWNVLAGINDPKEFLAGMSLTFEQANLDYARQWLGNFEKIGMETEAKVMDIVYREEIGHVKHGLLWLRKLDPLGLNDFQLHQHYLPPQLSMRKSKGEIFDRKARTLCGFDAEYIRQIELVGGTKNRSPDLVDLNLAMTYPQDLFKLGQDCESLGAIWASSDDFVAVTTIPSLNFQNTWRLFWGSNPQWIERNNLEPIHRCPRLRQYQPWSNDQYESSLYHQIACKFPSHPIQINQQKKWGSKIYSAQVLAYYSGIDPSWDTESGISFDTPNALLRFLETNPNSIVKSNQSAAGKGRLICAKDPKEKWSKLIIPLLERGDVLAEPWRNNICNLSALFMIEEQGVRHMGITTFDTDQRGTWRGSWVCDPYLIIPNSCLQYLRQVNMQTKISRIDLWIQTCVNFLSQEFWKQGFRGPLGIDALIWQDFEKQLHLRPLVEINPRMTFGHLAIKLRKKISHKIKARLRLRRISSLRKQGFEHGNELIESCKIHTLDGLGRWQEGLFALSDPSQAQDFLPVLEVGEKWCLSNLT